MTDSTDQLKDSEKTTKRVRELNNITLDITERDELIQSFTELITLTTGAKFSQVNIFDGVNQYTIASDGAQFPPLPKEQTFCQHTIKEENTLEIKDTTTDDRVKEHSAVKGEKHIRYYFGAPLITSNGVTIGTICIFHDDKLDLMDPEKEAIKLVAKQIINHLEYRNELINNKKQVEEYRRTLRKVIHDLRVPLSGIIGGLSMVDENDISKDLKQVLKIIRKSSKNLIEYINDSLKNILNSDQVGDFIPANTLIKKLQSLYNLQASNKKVKLEILSEIDEQENITTLSSGDLINIIGNLISNAIKFSPDGQTVSVSIGYKNDEKDHYKVVVADHGMGMSTEQINNIYELRVKESQEGTNEEQGFGIGLTEALRTLTQHDGTFEIDSEKDRGTRFMVLFPRKH